MSAFAEASTEASTGTIPLPEAPPCASRRTPIVVLIIGMAGAGKTTLMHRLNLQMCDEGKRAYYINLDPAVTSVPFSAHIDIRDTVNYKEVMQQYGLGPNGAILTSINLFATRFDQVVTILEKRAEELDYIFIDTPGQIEAFTWSAGGQIIHDLLGTSFPTTIMYIVDTPRCISPTTFMSNMLYACSVLYKSRLPMVCVFNKTDAQPADFAMEWMNDFEVYQEALNTDSNQQGGGEGYMGSLNGSLSLVLDEFYQNIRRCGVSAATGDGLPALFDCLSQAAEEFRLEYLPDLLRRQKVATEAAEARRKSDMKRLETDLREHRGERVTVDASKPLQAETPASDFSPFDEN
jgi:GTPase SAR1 family protein